MSELVTLGSLTLSDVCEAAVILDEGGGAYVNSSVRIPGRDGARIDPDGPLAPLVLRVEFVPKYTDAAGAPGFGHLNLSKVKAQLGKRDVVALVRTIDNIGQVKALVKQFTPMVEQRPNVYVATLFCPSGSWQDNTESDSGTASTTPSVTTEGDRDIHDPVIQFNAAGTLTHTEDDGDTATVAVAAGPTFPVTVWIAGTDGSSDLYAEDDGGADVTGDVTTNKAYGLRFAPGSSLTLSSTSAVIVKWRSRWA